MKTGQSSSSQMMSSVCVPMEDEEGTTTGTGIHAPPNVMKSYRAELGPDPVLISEESGDVAGDLRTMGVQESNELSTIPEEEGAGEEGVGVEGEGEERAEGATRGGVEGVKTMAEVEVLVSEGGESDVKVEDVGIAGVNSEGIGDAGVKSEGIGDAGVKSEGISDAGVKSEGTSDAGVKSEGIGNSVKSEDSEAGMKSEAGIENEGSRPGIESEAGMERGIEAGESSVKSEEREGDKGEGALLPPTETEGERRKMDLVELSSVLTASNEGEVVDKEVRAC